MAGKASFRTTANRVAATIPSTIDPRTFRACRQAVTSRPKKKTIKSGEVNRGLSVTHVSGCICTSPAFCRPMKAMNSPIPTAIPFRRLALIVSSNIRCTPNSESNRNNTPEMNTTPSATCQASVSPARTAASPAAAGIAENTKKKFSPMPGAWATG